MTLNAERDALKAERDTIKTERDTLKTERDALKAEVDRLEKLTGKAAKPPGGRWRRRQETHCRRVAGSGVEERS